MLVGTAVTATIWSVQFRHRNLIPPSRIVRMDMEGKKAPEFVEGSCIVLTADATGDDLRQVTERVVLGAKATPEHQLTLVHVHRVGDVRGLAQVEPHDGIKWEIPPPPNVQFVPASADCAKGES